VDGEEVLPALVRKRLRRGRLRLQRQRPERAAILSPTGALPCVWAAASADFPDLHDYLVIAQEDMDASENGGCIWVRLPRSTGVCLCYQRDRRGHMRRVGSFGVPPHRDAHPEGYFWVANMNEALALALMLGQEQEQEPGARAA
jgi:hypothetical protein